VKEVERIGALLVVFDTISSLWPVKDENNSVEVQTALMPLWNLPDTTGVVLGHHLNKRDGGEGTGSRGSGALPAFVDTILELRRYDANNLECCKRVITAYGRDDDTPPEMVIELDTTTKEYRALGDRKGADIEAIRHKVRKLLSAEGEGESMTYDDIEAKWPDKEFPRKKTMLMAIEAGVEQGDWM